jgi:putative addiction module CopG family antidote
MSVDIPAEFTPFVSSHIASGEFTNEGAVIERALRLLKAVKATEYQLRRDVELGFEQLRRNECLPGGQVLEILKLRAEEIARRGNC